jgi:hypothetical protein
MTIYKPWPESLMEVTVRREQPTRDSEIDGPKVGRRLHIIIN